MVHFFQLTKSTVSTPPYREGNWIPEACSRLHHESVSESKSESEFRLDCQSSASFSTPHWWCPVSQTRYPAMRKITFRCFSPYFLHHHTWILNLSYFNSTLSIYRVKRGPLSNVHKDQTKRKDTGLGRFSTRHVQMCQPAGLVMWIWKIVC